MVIASFKQQVEASTAESAAEKEKSRKALQRATALEQENLNLKKEISVASLEKQAQIKNLETAEDYIASLLEQINQEGQKKDSSTSGIQLLQNQYQEMRREKETLSANNSAIVRQNEQIKAISQSLQNEKKVLAAKTQALQIQNKALEHQVRESQLKLQSQEDKHQQNQHNVSELTKLLSESKNEQERASKELINLQDAHQKLAKQLQKKLDEEIQGQTKQ